MVRHSEADRDEDFSTMTEAESIAPNYLRRKAEVPKIIRQFTPNWFTVTMGTGVLALALNQFPIAIPGLRQIGVALWLINIGLFTVFSALYTARWLLCFDEARKIFHHSVVSMFFGAIPMGLATIINGFLVFGSPLLGDQAVGIAHGLWQIDAAMSIASGLLIPYFMFTRQDHSMEKMTAVWLLPIVACEVAAASGGLLAPHLADADGFGVLIASYVLWALSVPLALSILTILLLRLVVHSLPGRDMAASGWLALGPIGTGALGLLVLGGDAPHLFAAAGLAPVGDVAFGLGVIGGLVLWGYGVWWLLLAVMKTAHYMRGGMPFNLGWWGFTFPLGVYTLATLTLARITHLSFFSVTGGLLVICLAVFWAIVATRTVLGAVKGDLFFSPCLSMRVPDQFETDVV
jgi:C4-dicarboxylate transporter/malic acid transport protein